MNNKPRSYNDNRPKHRRTVDPARFRSKSKNTPCAGWKLTGREETVIVGGKVKYRAGNG